MQSVSNAYKQVVSSTSDLSPKFKIIIDGVEYLGDVIKTSPKITHSNVTFLGGFPAKTISFDIFDLENNLNLENKEIIAYKGLVIDGSIEWVKQGVFIPQAKDITHNISTKTITISNAQDKTQLFDKKYESSLDWSINHTGIEIIQEICNKLNVNLETPNFGWANYSFKQPNFSGTTTYREVVSRMAELGGEVALMSCEGGIQIKGQQVTGDVIQRHRYEKLSKEKPYVINTLALGKQGIEDDVVYPETIEGNRVEFRIEDNPFVDLYRHEMIEIVANYIIGKSYTPFELNGVVDGFIYELNDVVSVVDKNGDTFDAVILDYSNQSRIKSNVKAETLDKKTTNYNLVGSKANAIGQVKLEVDHINETITSLTSRVEDLSDYLKSASGTGTLILDETITSEGAIGKIVISGFNELGLYPSMVYPNSKIYPNKLSTYCIIQSNEDGSLIRETYIDLKIILGKTDELIIENSKVYIKSGNKITDTGLTALLRTYEDVTKISVKYFPNVSFNCDYIKKNELTKSFATQAEVSSQFMMTQENINSKVTKAEVISEINQTADEIKINANKISLEGIVTANQNFKILEDGSIESKNGSFSGNIYLQDGNKVIGGDGILTNLQFSSVGSYEGYGLLGFNYNSFNDSYVYADISIDVDIPSNFTIEQAYLTLYHTSATWSYYNESTSENIDLQGYARNLKLYETSGSNQNYSFYMTYGGEYAIDLSSGFLTEIVSAFGSDSFTPQNNYTTDIEVKKSIDIKGHIKTGETHKIVVRASDAIPTNERDACSKTGMARAVINVIGYMSR